ncbi:putative amino acid ligase [Tetragenococcus muriaticus PMC-11-5]|nr:putative amino acid ligase [Tetragenococcus muriaticus PMC-11-5]
MVNIDGKQCTLVLVKNPVGLNQVIDMIDLAPYTFSLVSLLNANYADGTDISWIWDGNYEIFNDADIPKVISGGERHEDMTKRLQVAGIPEEKLTETQNLDEVIEQIKQLPTEQVYILSTYTAILQLRKKLADKGYIKGGMDRG